MDPAVIHSTGWLITPSHKPGHRQLAQSYSPKDGALGECLFIPEAMIVDSYLLHPTMQRRFSWLAKAQEWLRGRLSWW